MLFRIKTIKQTLSWEIAERDIISMVDGWDYPKDEPSFVEIYIPFAVWQPLNQRSSMRRVYNILRKRAMDGSSFKYIMYPIDDYISTVKSNDILNFKNGAIN